MQHPPNHDMKSGTWSGKMHILAGKPGDHDESCSGKIHLINSTGDCILFVNNNLTKHMTMS
jgi:hypothetical protein